jgi:UDP-glucose 4-epimerase
VLEVIEAIEKVANSAKIRKVLGWSSRYDDLEFIVQTALAWERNPRF